MEYGLRELIKKLPDDCMVILCEADTTLFEFERERGIGCAAGTEGTGCTGDVDSAVCTGDAEARIFTPAPEDLSELPVWIYNHNKDGKYRRIIPIEFSAGVQFHKDFYKALVDACTDSIMTFWKNRVTLQKFGRKYCMNFFKNLAAMEKTTPVERYIESVGKQLLCFGAGESTDYFFAQNPEIETELKLDNRSFFILCADSALPALLDRGIKPDGVFIEEAQNVILKSFIGSIQCKDLHIFAGLSSVPGLRSTFPENQISYFFTQFTQAEFITRAEKTGCLPVQNPPFGSVGLTMVYYALRFRKSEDVPVYVCGLDFSYSAGRTHTRGTPHHKNRLIALNRIRSLFDFASAFNPNTTAFSDKTGKKFYTTQVLSGYAQLFARYFGATKNLFDAGSTGIPLSLPSALNSEGKLIYNAGSTGSLKLKNCKNKLSEAIEKYLSDEKNALIRLRELLTTEQGLPKEELQAQITELAQGREYLFLHYPDGCTFRYEQSFLNRIRTEIDFYLRIL